MAYRRSSLSIRATLFARRSNPSFSYLSHFNDRKKSEESQSSGSKIETLLTQRRSFGSCVSQTFRRTPYGQLGRTPFGLHGIDRSLRRQISTSSEVAIAAADSVFPSAVVQHFIDGVHCFTGLNWWASIAIATLLARVATLPFIISFQMKIALKIMDVMSEGVRLQNQEIAMGMEPQAVGGGKKRVYKLNREDALYIAMVKTKEIFVHICFFGGFTLAISNMAGKVASFKTGGALWFTDLSAPDAMHILPILLSLTYLIRMEYVNDKRRLVSIVGSMQDRVLALLWIPLTMYFPSALLCFGIATRMFTLCLRYGEVLELVSNIFRDKGPEAMAELMRKMIVLVK